MPTASYSTNGDARATLRGSYDVAVLRALNELGADPRVLDENDRTRMIADAITQVDAEDLARVVAWLCGVPF
ncbi:hypothetical protein [Haloechinothrix halophila]|uniref:hypothetical protein n=1 Tax=Haloechinothrix halophila TaxID=1069073 RepID=UPI00054DF91C|nr:hypothetical protein [Haloechinothrix halophila]